MPPPFSICLSLICARRIPTRRRTSSLCPSTRLTSQRGEAGEEEASCSSSLSLQKEALIHSTSQCGHAGEQQRARLDGVAEARSTGALEGGEKNGDGGTGSRELT